MAVDNWNVSVLQESLVRWWRPSWRFANVLAVVAIAQSTLGQEIASQAKNVVHEFSQKAAATYKITVGGDTLLDLQKTSVLSWSNPIRRSRRLCC